MYEKTNEELLAQALAAKKSGKRLDINKPYGQQTGPGTFDGMTDSFEHATESMAGNFNATMAAYFEDDVPEASSIYSKRLQKNIARQNELAKGMGTGAHIASGVIQSVPTIAPMVLTAPLGGGIPAGMALTGLISGGQTTGEILQEQARRGEEFDMGTAVKHGAMTAATDAATSLVPIHKLASRAGRTIAGGVEGGFSGAQSQMQFNAAMGDDLTNNLGTSTLIGSITGSSLASLVPNTNKGGQDAADSFKANSRLFGNNPDQAYARKVVQYRNDLEAIDDAIANAPDAATRNSLLHQRRQLTKDDQGLSAVMNGFDLLREEGLDILCELSALVQ